MPQLGTEVVNENPAPWDYLAERLPALRSPYRLTDMVATFAALVDYRGPSLDNALLNTVVFVPFATGEALGIPEERSFTRPWLMSAGTAFAHIMIPGQ